MARGVKSSDIAKGMLRGENRMLNYICHKLIALNYTVCMYTRGIQTVTTAMLSPKR